MRPPPTHDESKHDNNRRRRYRAIHAAAAQGRWSAAKALGQLCRRAWTGGARRRPAHYRPTTLDQWRERLLANWRTGRSAMAGALAVYVAVIGLVVGPGGSTGPVSQATGLLATSWDRDERLTRAGVRQGLAARESPATAKSTRPAAAKPKAAAAKKAPPKKAPPKKAPPKKAPAKQTPAKKAPAPKRAAAKPKPVAGLSQAQMNNAAAIVQAGRALKLPRRAFVIAVATAMQESTLRNLASDALPESLRYPNQGVGSDHDSVGLFQQRPSAGWGSVRNLMRPGYAATQFYLALRRVPGWQTMPLTVAAQRVQVSAYPDAYAKHERLAMTVVNALS